MLIAPIKAPGLTGSGSRDVLLFYVLSAALSWPAMLLWDLPATFQPGDTAAVRDAYARVGVFFGFGPMIAALIVAALTSGWRGLRELASRVVTVRMSPAWYVAALVVPILGPWLGTSAWVAIGGEPAQWPPFTSWLVRWLPLAVFHGLFAVGEELGWRGFMLPRVLAGRGWMSASVIVGAAWAAWHYPLYFAANRALTGSAVGTLVILGLVTVTILAVSVITSWMFTQTRGSVLPAMLFHGSINANMNLIYEAIGDRALARIDLLASTTAATVAVAGCVVFFARWRERASSRRIRDDDGLLGELIR